MDLELQVNNQLHQQFPFLLKENEFLIKQISSNEMFKFLKKVQLGTAQKVQKEFQKAFLQEKFIKMKQQKQII